MRVVDRLPWWLVIAAAISLGLAPFQPEPHLVEKLRMLWLGTLTKPVDMFDLAMHAAPWLFVLAKVSRLWSSRATGSRAPPPP